jgi:DNA polymerase-3 subunit alpha
LKLKSATPATPQEKLGWEKELLGLYVSDHPLNHYRPKIEQAKVSTIKDMLQESYRDKRYRIAGLVSRAQPIVTKTGKPMLFAKIEDFSDSVEVVVFPETLLKTNEIWKESGIVIVTGKLSARNGAINLICDQATEL